jgi:benzoyl-CoA 2,3-dioxygenase component B
MYPVVQPDNGELVSVDTPALSALNERLRDDFIADVSIGVRKWNRLLRDYGIDMELSLPHRGFNRNIGLFRDVHLTPTGDFISAQEWDRRKSSWLPTPDDMAYVCSLMSKATVEPGEFASWIAPPARGIDKRPIEFDYIRFA